MTHKTTFFIATSVKISNLTFRCIGGVSFRDIVESPQNYLLLPLSTSRSCCIWLLQGNIFTSSPIILHTDNAHKLRYWETSFIDALGSFLNSCLRRWKFSVFWILIDFLVTIFLFCIMTKPDTETCSFLFYLWVKPNHGHTNSLVKNKSFQHRHKLLCLVRHYGVRCFMKLPPGAGTFANKTFSSQRTSVASCSLCCS
jgi:hypothetical protein